MKAGCAMNRGWWCQSSLGHVDEDSNNPTPSMYELRNTQIPCDVGLWNEGNSAWDSPWAHKRGCAEQVARAWSARVVWAAGLG